MGILLTKISENLALNGNGLADNYKKNTMFFFEKYKKTDKDVKSIPLGQIQLGGFYFLHYKDQSNWMKYSPIFTVAHKKFDNLIILLAINFNFIPLEVRVVILDRFLIEQNFDNDTLLTVDYNGVYAQLLKYGFEYAIVEYNLAQIEMVHKISMDLVPRFLYSGFPINKYDPQKLYSIWKAKIKNQADRHQEITKSVIKDFFDVENEIKKEYIMLEDHIKRLRESIERFGK